MKENKATKNGGASDDDSADLKGAGKLPRPKGSSVKGTGHKTENSTDDSSETEGEDSRTAAKPKGSSVRGTGH